MCNNLYRVIPTHFSTSPGMFLHKIIYSLIWVTPFGAADTRYHHLLFHCHEMEEEVFFENDGILGRQSRTSYLSSIQICGLAVKVVLIPCPRTGYWCYSVTPTPGFCALIVQSFLFLIIRN